MSKNIIIVFSIIIAIFTIWIFFFRPKPASTTISLNGQNYQLEIAKTIPQQTKGLMNRRFLCSNCGMIFTFSSPIPLTFWMKDTLIPLDIIFIDQQGTIINIESAYPQVNVPDNQLTIYRSLAPAQYVIELNLGDSQKLKLLPGTKIKLDEI